MSAIPEILTCSVCLEAYKKPRRLPNCVHVFCEDCVDKLTTGNKLTCPECRVEQKLPPGGGKDLPHDIKISQLVETLTCCDCTNIRSTTDKCSLCQAQSCRQCLDNLHTDKDRCVLLTEIRKMKSYVPEGSDDWNFDDGVAKWADFMKENRENRKQIEISFKVIETALEKKKKEILDKLHEYEEYAYEQKFFLQDLKEGKRILKDMCATFIELTEDDIEYYTELSQQLNRNLVKIDVAENMLQIPEPLGRVYEEEVLRQIKYIGHRITSRMTGKDRNLRVLWAGQGGVKDPQGKVHKGLVEVRREKGGQYEMRVTRNSDKKILQSIRWNGMVSGGPSVHAKVWTSIPWRLQNAKEESTHYSTEVEDDDERYAFQQIMRIATIDT